MPFVVRLLVAWAVDAASLAIAAWIFTGISVGGSAGTLIVAALVYGILATFVKPVLKLLTLRSPSSPSASPGSSWPCSSSG